MDMRSILVLLLLVSAVAHAQGSSDAPIVISGTVTDSVTGRGIAGVAVSLQAGPSKKQLEAFQVQMGPGDRVPLQTFPQGSNLRAVTEEDGKFSFSLAEPTFVSVQVTRGGYMADAGRMVSGGERLLDIKLVPLGAIEGRFVDANGEPLRGISIQLIQAAIDDGRKILRPLATLNTDDRGQYRFWNLVPGFYYVRALGRQGINSRMGGISTPPEALYAFPSMYFPGVPDRQSASLVRVLPGQSFSADFTSEARKSYRIRGTIKDTSLYTGPGVRLMRGEEAVGNRVSIDTLSGSFVVYDVTPGSYTLQAFANGSKSLALGEIPISVGEGDLSGVEVRLSTGVEVRGKVEHSAATARGVDQDDDPPSNAPRRRRLVAPVQAIILEPGRLPQRGTQPPATVDDQGNFTFTDMLPGRYAFSVPGFGEYAESVRSGATDVLADGLEVGTVAPEPLTITLASGTGNIKGSIAGLQPGKSATVLLIRANGLSGVPMTTQATREPNSTDVGFQVYGLPPGDYTLIAWPSTQQVEFRNPEALRAISGKAVRVTLREGVDEQVSLEVIAVEN